ncbi:MAG: sigma-70 family RNA polymerase sigma factor, partial [Proteobacteria bacterium]|nr:sigma-70 family RNA polymerase sigma factor [Pseudomonadota bacterium]
MNDTASFEDLLVQALPSLRAFARFLTGRREQADDLVNETILRALSAKDQFQPGTNLKAWLFTILRNQHINEFRRRRMNLEQGEPAAELALSAPPGQIPSVELGEVRAALARMSRQHREALVLVAAAGLSYEETAAICKCAVGTVKSRL